MRVRIAIALVVLTAACSAAEDSPQVGSGQAAQAEALPFDQQTLTMATPGDVFITRGRNLLGMWPDNANICEPLLGVDQNLQTVPVLATKYTYMGDNTFRFELRRNVTFHNGTPMTPRPCAPPSRAWPRSSWAGPASSARTRSR